ncbi:hypothetical protein Acidovoranil_11400 [Acidovorax sp. FG27]
MGAHHHLHMCAESKVCRLGCLGKEDGEMSGSRNCGPAPANQHDADNRANQLNPNHDAYWQSRGEDGRPDDWMDRSQSGPDD